MRSSSHLTHQALLLHLAPELAQSLLELFRAFDDYLQTLITPFLLLFAKPPGSRPQEDHRPGQRGQE